MREACLAYHNRDAAISAVYCDVVQPIVENQQSKILH